MRFRYKNPSTKNVVELLYKEESVFYKMRLLVTGKNCIQVKILDKSENVTIYPVITTDYYCKVAYSFKIASKYLVDFKSALSAWGIKEFLGCCRIDDEVSQYFYAKEEFDYKFEHVHQRELCMVGVAHETE